jgi:hypothetical protein
MVFAAVSFKVAEIALFRKAGCVASLEIKAGCRLNIICML